MKIYWLTLIAFGLFSNKVVYADDTEIYRNTQNRVNPNVIFLIDTSGSMAYRASENKKPHTGEDTRLEIVQRSAVNAISQLDPSLPINIAVMRFDEAYGSYQGGSVMQHFVATDSESDKNTLINTINSLSNGNIGGGTPITESMYEAYRYMTGKSPHYGDPEWSNSNNLEGIRVTYNYWDNVSNQVHYVNYLGSVPQSISNGKYRSPVTATCQKNHIVLFTDGAASSDVDANSRVKNLIDPMQNLPSGLSKSCSNSGGCTEELAYFLQQTDHFTDSDLTGENDPNASEIDQPIYVHTVGGFSGITSTEKQYLSDIAKFGHPLTDDELYWDADAGKYFSKHYYSASDESGLTSALLKVFGGIANTAGNFAAPVVAVNAFNSLEHREELYYSVFKPSEMPGWSGNIKRYKMNSAGTILDQNSAAAIDPNTGFFKDSAKSFWTIGDADGSDVESGGMANRLPAGRNVFTNLQGSGTIRQTGNRIHEDNNSITAAMLDDRLPSGTTLSSADREDALQWARGINPNTGQARRTLADPLHGNPILVTYRTGTDTLEDVLYTGTNAGYIHAFDTNVNSPGELWAFMPRELLPNIAVYQRGEGSMLKAYGIDGPLTIQHNDKNQDGVVDSDDTVYLVAGMRRGGNSYFALDVSDRTNPKFVAQIKSGDTGFEELGQTWSRMMPATVMWQGQETDVFFFGGGYDQDEDNATQRITHDVGNAIYMVKANNEGSGNMFDLLWKANGRFVSQSGFYSSEMTSSFAGDLSLIDNDGNGTVDTLYGADVGGRIWRFDINEENTSKTNFAKGGVIADLNSGTAAGNTRFYTQPDVIYTDYGYFEYPDPDDSSNMLSRKIGRYQITIGSGFRAGPLSTATKDHLFVINDFNVDEAPSSYTKLSMSDLADYSSFASASATKQMNGFYVTLQDDGEKILSTTLTVNDVIYAPTFRPSDSTIEIGCEPDSGQARLLQISPYDAPDTTERIVTQIDLNQGGIVPKPVLVFPPSDSSTGQSSTPVVAIGTEVIPAGGK